MGRLLDKEMIEYYENIAKILDREDYNVSARRMRDYNARLVQLLKNIEGK